MGETKIQWTDATWNPLRGCSEVSPGCARCYAAGVAARFSGPGQPYEGLAYRDANGRPHWTGKVRTAPHKLAEPLSWRTPRMVFVNSMSDLFHEDVPDAYILETFDVMRRCTWAGGGNCGRIGGGAGHTFQVLTKRAERMADVCGRMCWDGETLNLDGRGTPMLALNAGIWLGVSVEDQRRADERVPHLLRTPARVRFLSCEPLLGAVDLTWVPDPAAGGGDFPGRYLRDGGIHWVICGGESGPGARPCEPAWVRSVVAQCRAAGVAAFVKQLGSWWAGRERDEWGCNRDHKGGDPSEWPEDLGVRQFPKV